MIAPASDKTLNPQAAVPRHVKLLGAKVEDLGVITFVGEQTRWRWALIEDAGGKEHHVFLCDLAKDKLELPAEQQPYRHVTRRIGYGLIESGYELLSVPFSDLTHVDPLEAAA